MDDIDNGEKLSIHQYEVSGIIVKMSDEELDKYYEYIASGAVKETNQDLFLPYYLDVCNYGNNLNSTAIYLFGAVGILLIIAGLYTLIMALTGQYQKPIKHYIRNSGSPEGTVQSVEQFLATAPILYDFQYDEHFLCYRPDGIVTFFNETDKLIWAYKVTERQKVTKLNEKIVLYKNSILLFFTDGKVQQCRLANETQENELIYILGKLCPKAIIGYSLELEELFDRDLNTFLKMTYYSTSDL